MSQSKETNKQVDIQQKGKEIKVVRRYLSKIKFIFYFDQLYGVVKETMP